MKQFHWGHGILVFFIFYISYLVWTVVASRQIDHSLVLDDYYALDLAYQDRYLAAANSLHSKYQPNVQYEENSQQLVVDFPDIEVIDGALHLYRPSNAALDQQYPLKSKDEENNYTIDVSKLKYGKWIAKTQWNFDGQKYYKEDIIFITKP